MEGTKLPSTTTAALCEHNFTTSGPYTEPEPSNSRPPFSFLVSYVGRKIYLSLLGQEPCTFLFVSDRVR